MEHHPTDFQEEAHSPSEALRLEALEPLDLRVCRTVSDILRGYSRTSFGARMLGEVAETLTEMVKEGRPSTLVYDGDPASSLTVQLELMASEGFFSCMQTPEECVAESGNDGITAVGSFSDRQKKMLCAQPGRSIFINRESFAKSGQVKDGHFPDAVFNEPALVMPLLQATLRERLHGEPTTVTMLIEQFAQSEEPFQREVANGAQTLRAMVEDPDCHVFLTVSGAMTVAQMYHVIDDMIQDGMVDSVTSTGALMAHGLMPGMGLKHYKYNSVYSDIVLARHKLNRVTDTLEPETNFDQAAEVIDAVLESLPDGISISSSHFHRLVGEYLNGHYPHERAILKTAYQKHVPIFVPAFVDSELGNDTFTHNIRRRIAGRQPVQINPQLDQERMITLTQEAKRLGIFSIGGGVPRNHVQNLAPLLEITNDRVPESGLAARMFSYGVRIAPDQMHHGHLSGCTYAENSSWRKFHPDARTAEIQADGTIVWPLFVKYIMECR